jgi:hypothetical protein
VCGRNFSPVDEFFGYLAERIAKSWQHMQAHHIAPIWLFMARLRASCVSLQQFCDRIRIVRIRILAFFGVCTSKSHKYLRNLCCLTFWLMNKLFGSHLRQKMSIIIIIESQIMTNSPDVRSLIFYQ